MGVAIPQIVTEDRAGGAQIVDGGLRFDDDKSHVLQRTSSAGSTTWTWSGWVKRSTFSTEDSLFGGYDGSTATQIYFKTDNTLRWYEGGADFSTTPVYRDPSGWYHFVCVRSGTSSLTIYVNGTQVAQTTSSIPSTSPATTNNAAIKIGAIPVLPGGSNTYYFDGQLSNVYLIDGQALDASYFGYTDPLTNTWRPKKFNKTVYTNRPVLYKSSTLYTTKTDIINNATLVNGGESVSSEYVYVIANDGGNVGASAFTNGWGAFVRHWYYSSGWNNPGSYNSGEWTSFVWGSSISSYTLPNNLDFTLFGSSATGTPGTYTGTVPTLSSNSFKTDNFGTNGFYLPFDGSAPIGQDQSGRGNNWAPVNFGGSNTLEKATGALPILNTDGGGKVARVGVRTDSSASSLVLALPLVGIKSDFSNAINSGTSNKAVTTVGNAAASSVQSNFYGGSFTFDGTGDALTITNSDMSMGTSDFTCEGWFYYNALPSSSAYRLLGNVNVSGNSTEWQLIHQTAGTLTLWNGSSYVSTGTAPISTNRWTHLAVVRASNVQTLYVNGIAQSTTVTHTGNLTHNMLDIGGRNDGAESFNGYIQDVRIYKGLAKYTQNFIPASTDPDILPDTPSGVAYSSNVALVPSTDGGSIALNGTGDYLKTVGASSDFAMGNGNFTIEMFIYPQTIAVSSPGILSWSSTEGTTTDYTNAGFIAYGSNGTIDVLLGTNSSYASISTPTSGPLLKFNSWNHLAIVRDTGNTFRVFVNGELAVTDTSTLASTNITAQYMNFGAYYSSNYMVRGFISNVHVVKGTALYSSNFTPPVVGIASTTNTKLLFAKSGISTTATEVTPSGVTIGIAGAARVTNFNPFTVNINTQRGQESGYATLNPLAKSTDATLSNGNLTFATTGTATYSNSVSTIGVSSGKWYYEFTTNSGPDHFWYNGWAQSGYTPTSNYVGATADSYGYSSYLGQVRTNGSQFVTYSTWRTVGDTIGFALDLDNGKIYFSKNGIWQGGADPSQGTNPTASGLSGTWYAAVSGYDTTNGSINFGQKPFKFPPPAGFQPLALANTPRPTIVRPDQYVGVTTYTGTGAPRDITVGWKPDFVWIKNRTVGRDHRLFDTVRGIEKELRSSATDAEATDANSVTAFTSSGFSVGSNTGINESSSAIVAWAWKAGGSGGGLSFWKDDVGYATASAAGLTAGTITPTGASVNTKSGFSIIKYSHTINSPKTIAHGLTRSPEFMIAKFLDGSTNWNVYHASATGAGGGAETGRLLLNSTNAYSDEVDVWNDTAPTNQVWTVGGSSWQGSGNHITYLWHSVPGFSKFGSYVGNSSSDGPMVITGFKPRWIMIKSSTSAYGWYIYDTARDPYNISGKELLANEASAEVSDSDIDILSNGFKLRRSSLAFNTSSNTFIYACFAETPSFNLYGGQANAR